MLRVKEICREKGITILQLSEKIGMMQPSLSRIINGSNTTTETLQKIADALEVPIYELFEQPSADIIVCPKCGTKFKMDKE